jgi:two-component system cell cycle response regulator
MNESGNLILIVDDLEENLLLLSRILSRNGFRVATTSDSSEVVKLCQKAQPTLVLLDINMPGTDGVEVCKQLKKEPTTSSIPVIFVSALESTADRLRGFEAGAVDYIIKPIEIEETLARVNRQISMHNMQAKLQVVNSELDKRLEELTLSQQQLKEREQKLNGLIKALPNTTFVYDEEGNYLEIFSNEFRNLIAPIEEMLGKNIADFLPPELVKEKIDAIRSVIKTEQAKIFEYELPFKDGKRLWFEGRMVLMSKEKTGKAKVICVTTEITERVELYKKVENLAILDPLTNCFNRRHFIDLAEKEVYRAKRFVRPLALMIMDIDHFKHINDTYGHPSGDEVLKQLVELFHRELRSSDMIGRYGGEEFCVLFPETNTEGAYSTAERIRKSIENYLFHSESIYMKITISAGVACLDSMNKDNPTLGDLFVAADKALYVAKTAGRNRVQTNCSALHANLKLKNHSNTKPLRALVQ